MDESGTPSLGTPFSGESLWGEPGPSPQPPQPLHHQYPLPTHPQQQQQQQGCYHTSYLDYLSAS